MRILVVGMNWIGESPGGLNRYAFDLAMALRNRGLGVEGIVVGSPNPDQGFVGATESAAPIRRRLWTMAWEGRARSRAADLINSHFALYTLPLLLSHPDKPLVVHFQGPWHREAATESPEPHWMTALRKQVESSVYRRADEVIVLSEAFRQIVINFFGILPGRVHVVRPGVDLERFRPIDQNKARERLGLPRQGRAMLSVRRLTKRVGLDVLLRAWGAAESQDATLYIVGDGPERGRLQALAGELGVESTVRFVGPVSDADLPFWYAAADLSVVPSITLEGFGLVVLESLACGTPVIASDTGGMAEVLPDLAEGLLIPPGDTVRLAHALIRVLEGEDSLPAREECRRFAEGFQWRNAADRVVEVFEQARVQPPLRNYRVVFLDHCAKLSGGELALLRLLKGAGTVESHVILAENGPLVDALRKADISVEVLPLPSRVANLSRVDLQSLAGLLRGGTATAVYVAQLVRRLRRLHPDLVHTNSLKSGVYGSIAARLAGIPVIWHVRDRLSEDSYPASQASVLRRCVTAMADGVVANSAATASLLRPGRASVWVIPSPIDVAPVARPAVGPPVVGIIGRLAPWKGQHVFLDAMAQVLRKHPDLNARVIGSSLFGEEDYSEQLRCQSNELGIADGVDFVSFREDIAAELARLTVAVHASTVPEPFGQVVVEAMACGVPVVATNAGGPAEIIDDGTDGLLVPGGNPEALAEAVGRLLEDADLRDRLSQAGLEKAERYRPERVAAEIEAVYATVLARQETVRS
jgi:glycosyltransferase involved in cell wall biosynthesis